MAERLTRAPYGSTTATAPDADICRTVDLKELLVKRVTLFALVIGIAASGLILHLARERIKTHIARAGGTVERLISSELVQPRGEFHATLERLEGLELKSLDEIGQVLGICVAVEDIYKHPVIQRCFGQAEAGPGAVSWLLSMLIGPEMAHRGRIGKYPGVKVGEFAVTPNLDNEALWVWDQVRIVIGMTLGILLLNLLVYLPVRRVLRPTEEILAVLGRMEAGDVSARMPRPGLIELRRIAMGFDHLAIRLQATLDKQRQLAKRLLSLREEERRYLARELHDEFGQCLTSIAAEVAFIATRTQGISELLPATRSISSVTAHMMGALQDLLGRLRPQGLEEFGLGTGLAILLDSWRRRQADCVFDLHVEGEIDDLPDELRVSLYRIVQESLTNALRHGAPHLVKVSLIRDRTDCNLSVEDDGAGAQPETAGTGLGVLGMSERVAAFGGDFSISPRQPHGMRVQARFPLTTTGGGGADV